MHREGAYQETIKRCVISWWCLQLEPSTGRTMKSPETIPPTQPDVAAEASGEEAAAASRRAALLRMSGYAASMAPAMLVLMSAKGTAKPDCDNPAWKMGLSRSGHSGC